MAAVRAATRHWIVGGGAGSLPGLIRQADRQVAGNPPDHHTDTNPR
jgi:hypothetical protein